MNRQTFLHYLEEPAKLYQLPLIELQGLVLEFPYSPNLRLLLLLKARLEDHPRQQEMLQQLASRTFDREHLHDLIRDLDRAVDREAAAKEERLELPDLNELDFAFASDNTSGEKATEDHSIAAEIPLPEPPERTSSIDMQDDLLVEIDEEVLLTDEESLAESFGLESLAKEDFRQFEPEKPLSSTSPPIDLSSETALEAELPAFVTHLLPTAIVASEVLRNFHLNYRPPVPQPTEELVGAELVENETEKVKARLRRHRKKQLDRLKHRERDRLKEIARQSVSAHDEVASETLAKLLTMQGQYAKAIKMYQRLSLQNPEKSPIFAGLIKELKEKL